ncbi:hypothetical protein [uncultured Agrococcus sp.]|uniref:hypothetical protein n=1 Tax=uncultured Agrococcus sp. TaxID=382258 RepID=UPI0025D550FB|nr:hypothetical protein [uncultured Agrococcus sp.]
MDTLRTLSSSSQDGPTGQRRLIGVGVALGVIMLASGLVWLIAPALSPYASPSMPVQRLVEDSQAGERIIAATQAAIGGGMTTAGLFALFGRPSAQVIAWLGPAAGLASGLGFVGFNGLAAAGYTLALSLPVAAFVTVVTFAIKRPGIGVPTALVVVGGLVFALFGPLSLIRFYGVVAAGSAVDIVKFFVPLMFILFSGVWTLLGARLLRRRDTAIGRFALRHRVPITVASAACALPYVVARLSWLTPWPLFGGEATASPEVLATGLMLGAAMLAGAVLNLGLILPWGERFPRWFPRVGGRPVPVSLAVVPAMIVAALFTAAGFDAILTLFAYSGVQPVSQLSLLFVLPFWLWGPLLALATWGYAQNRARSA